MRTTFGFVAALMLLPSCSHRRILPSSDWTNESAKQEIRDYFHDLLFLEELREYLRRRQLDPRPWILSYPKPLSVNDEHFEWPRGRLNKYRELGVFVEHYHWANALTPLTLLIMGPTLVQVNYIKPGESEAVYLVDSRFSALNRINGKRAFMSFVPFWLLGLPLWLSTREERVMEALMYMRQRSVAEK